MPFLKIQIVRFVDESQPGWVAAEFIDANGTQHTIIDKVPIFTKSDLRSDSVYPQPGVAACEILNRMEDDQGRRLARITVHKPWGLESVNGETEFVVLESQLAGHGSD
jgi:hypothetical protein